MRLRPLLVGVLCTACAGTALAACGATAHDREPSAAALARELRGSPPPLAALHREAGRLLGGGAAAVRARLRALRGYPVVVTQWASTCQPCQVEFGYFQALSAALGRRVAFLGNDEDTSTAAARAWLRRFPVSFPSYHDSGDSIALTLNSTFADFMPVTYFYDRHGAQVFAHAGSYLSEHVLRAEIRSAFGV